MTSVSEEVLAEIIKLYEQHGSFREIERVAGIPRTTARHRYGRAVRLGLAKPFEGMVPAGMEVHKYSTQHDKDGNLRAQSIKMGPESGDPFELAPGQRIKGESVLMDADANVLMKWVKTGEEPISREHQIKIIKDEFAGYVPLAAKLSTPMYALHDRLTVYPALDWHLGMYAWGEQTGDKDWNLTTATKTISEAYSELIAQSPYSEEAILMGLGDLMHIDNSENRTKKSGNALDVDTIYPKILRVSCQLLIEVIELLAAKHQKVRVLLKRGNHDEESTQALLLALSMKYYGHERIIIDDSANPFFFYQFGVNLIGGTHGDQQKMTELPMMMANRCAKEWGETSTRHFYTGHIHHETARDHHGVKVMSLRAPIPKDAWHGMVGFMSARSIYAYHYDRTKGSKGHSEVELK